MKNIIKLSLITALTISAAYAADEAVGAEDSVRKKIAGVGEPEIVHGNDVNDFGDFFKKGKVSGQLELMYSGYNETGTNSTSADPYSTAIGGQLKFDTGHWNGFGAGVEFTTVQEIRPLSGDNDDGERATMLVSTEGDYTEVSQAYLEYINDGITLRAGRQLIDTPLADSDDIRIVNNTFEAYIAMYETDNLSLMGGYLHKWQGTDTGLVNDDAAPADTDAWQETGEDGTYFAGVNYDNDLFHLGAWYYDISETDANENSLGQNVANRSVYVDTTLHAIASDDFSLDVSAQYLQQSSEDGSDIEADIYGVMAEVSISDLGLIAAYNRRDADDDETSFSGFGGGTLFTNMDNMIIDAINGGDVDAYMIGATYAINDFTVGYAYSAFDSDSISGTANGFDRGDEDIIEHNIGAEYAYTDNLTFFAIVTISEDKENTGTSAINNSGDFTNVRASVSYNF